MYKDTFKIFEFGVSSGNNASFLAKLIEAMTGNYKYFATEHPSSIKEATEATLEQLQEKGVNPNHFEFISQKFEEFKPLEEKADLVVASHCLAFCQKDKFYEFMQAITSSLKDGGVFMGELYLDKMGPRFMLNQSSAIQLLQGKINSQGKYVQTTDTKSQSIFKGFDVKAQITPNGQMVHFVATKTNCPKTTFEQTEFLVDYTNAQISDIAGKYSAISRSAEAKEHRGDWVNYAQIYKGLPARPLVHSIFESEQGEEWLQNRVCQNNLGLTSQEDLQNATLPFGQIGVPSTEQDFSQNNLATDNNQQNILNDSLTNSQSSVDENPEMWSIHFNQETDKLPQGNVLGKAYDDLPESARQELESVMPKSLYPEEEQDAAPVQTLKPTTTDDTTGTTV